MFRRDIGKSAGIGLLALGMFSALSAEELPFSRELNNAARYIRNISEKVDRMTIRGGTAGEIVFEADFTGVPRDSRWIYPYCKVAPGTFSAAPRTLSFEIKVEPSDPAMPCGACVMVVGGLKRSNGCFGYNPRPFGKWKKIEIDLRKQDIDWKKVTALRIGLNPQSEKIKFTVRNVSLRGEKPGEYPADTVDVSRAITTGAPACVFLKGEPLTFRSRLPAPASIQLRDIDGKISWKGSVKPGKFQLPPLDCGYYYLECVAEETPFPAANERTFAVVPPPGKRPAGKISHFSIDTGVSNIQNASRETMLKLIPRMGLYLERDRDPWDERTNPKPGVYTFDFYKKSADILRKAGVDKLGMIHFIPRWSNTGKIPLGDGWESKNRNKRLHRSADDLRSIYEFCRNYAAAMGEAMAFCEVWNEPDLMPDSVWEYAANQKAACLGLKAGNPQIKVLSAAFCRSRQSYVSTFLDNDGGYYFDIFNCHFYGSLSGTAGMLKGYRGTLEKHGLGNRPIFITENGTNYEDALPPRRGFQLPQGKALHSDDQERIVAEFLVKSQLESLRCGATVNFFFYLPSYFERNGRKDWGLLRPDSSAKQGVLAFAVLSHELAFREYLGTHAVAPGIKGMLFAGEAGEQTLVFWRRSEMDNSTTISRKSLQEKPGTVTLSLPDGACRLTDFYGRSRTLRAADGRLTLPVSSLPAYLRGKLELTGQTGTAGRKLEWNAHIPETVEPGIVLRLIPGDGFVIDSGRESARLLKPEGSLVLEVYNFTDSELSGTLRATGMKLAGLPDKLTVPAGGCHSLKLDSSAGSGSFRDRLRIDGEFGSRRITGVEMPFMRTCDPSLLRAQAIDAGRPENWEKNSSGRMEITGSGGEVSFHTTFSNDIRWSYPRYRLRKQESFKGAVALSFEMKVEEKLVKRPGFCQIYFKSPRGTLTRPYVSPGTADWTPITVFLPEDEIIDHLESFEVGRNTDGDSTFHYRNFRVLYSR